MMSTSWKPIKNTPAWSREVGAFNIYLFPTRGQYEATIRYRQQWLMNARVFAADSMTHAQEIANAIAASFFSEHADAVFAAAKESA